MVQCFPTTFLQDVSSLLYDVQSGIFLEENHTTTKKTGMFSYDGLLQALQCGVVPVGINCASIFQGLHQQYT
jgi:hypothetical protein